MPDDPRVQQLLDDLSEQETTPEEVCSHCPELLPVVRARWRQICRARAELDALLPVDTEESRFTRAAEDQPLPQVPGYEVDSVLGHGGMGIVFRARHIKLCRVVALKMTLTGSYAGEQEQKRFRREAEAVAALRHAHVVQIYEIGELGGCPYFTMELIEGGSLAQKQARSPQPIREAAALLATLAEAVHAAHQGGIIHRDLKPANILFTPDGTPKITDFGLARRIEGGAELTLSGVPLGTPGYMSPEQARGQSREIGPATDIYALGAILYELLTGRPPFRGETTAETLLQVIHDEPILPAKLNRKVSRDLQTICLTCLQKEPRLRYVTAAALADDLQRFLRGEPIAARPEANLMRWFRKVCRQPLLSAAVVIAVLSTLAFAGGGLWLVSDRSAKALAARDDVRDMVRSLNDASWIEARAARDRANGRLGDSAPAPLRRLIDQGTRDLDTAARLDAIHLKEIDGIAGGVPFEAYDQEFTAALRAADLGTIDESPEVVASRIRKSDLRGTLIAALDRYAMFMHAQGSARSEWALEVARRADADQSGWRLRARDLSVIRNRAALQELIATTPGNDPFQIPLIALEAYISDRQFAVADRLAVLQRLNHMHPGDFWINLRIGGFLRQNKMYSEAVGYIQAATELRPKSAVARSQFAGALLQVGRREESAEQSLLAAELDPTVEFYHQSYIRRLTELGRDDAAVEYLRELLRARPDSAFAQTELALSLKRGGQEDEALVRLTKAVELDPTRLDAQKALREYWLKRGDLKTLQATQQAAIVHSPSQYSAWYGYAELCLFLDKKDEYLRARRELLTRFGATTEARTAEQISRLSLLLPAAGDELATAAALSQRALASESAKSSGFNSYFLFARGLVEYRQEKFDEAIATMQGDASRVLGPAPRLVLSMALHRSGKELEARKTLAAAVTSYDWRPELCRSQDAWIFHVLRREAEQLIVPNLAQLMAGDQLPQDQNEQLALVGICQFMERTVAVARIYDEAFAADADLMEANGRRYAAAKAAAQAGCGHGSDAAGLQDAERGRWRKRALGWLRQELGSCRETLKNGNEPTRAKILKRLQQWQTEKDLAELRESASLDKLPANERQDWLDLWAEVRALLTPPEKSP